MIDEIKFLAPPDTELVAMGIVAVVATILIFAMFTDWVGGPSSSMPERTLPLSPRYLQ